MQAFQMKLQKVLIIGCLVLAGTMLAYALGFSTDLYALSYHTDSSSSLLYVPGSELYLEVQPFNRAFFMHTVRYFALTITLFISLSHRRRLYYLFNYITGLLFAAASVVLGVYLLTHVVDYKDRYINGVDFEKYASITERMRMQYVESTLMLDIGICLSVILFVAAAAVVINLALKTYWMRCERWKEDDDEKTQS